MPCLALLALLTLLSALAFAALILALPEGAVAQLLLLADHVAELVQRLHHVVAVFAILLARPRHLQVFQHLLQFLQQPLGGFLGARARKLLEPVDHVLQILRAQIARIRIHRPRHLRILPHLLGQRLQEFVERRAQFLGQLLDFVFARTALQRLTQSFLRRAQRRFGVGNVAVLEPDRHVPQPHHDIAQRVVGPGAGQLPVDRAQSQIDRSFDLEDFRRDGERVERGQHLRLGFAIEREIAALFDQGARHRLGERPLGQPHVERLGAAFIAAFVGGAERQRDVGAGPGMFGEIAQGLGDAASGARLRQHQRHVGRAVERTRGLGSRIGIGGLRRLQREIGARFGDAVIVLDLVIQHQRTAQLRLGILGQRDRRRAIRDRLERPDHRVADAAQGDLGLAPE